MIKRLLDVVRDEEGATMVEYALLLAIISVAAIGVLTTLGPKVKSAFQSANDAMPSTP